MNELYSNTKLKERLYECVANIFLTPEDFAFNLKQKSLIKTPKSIPQKPAHYFQVQKELHDLGNYKFTESMMNFYQTITFVMAHELFFHPLVKAYAKKIYLEKVKVSTRPKTNLDSDDNESKIDIYKPDYCVKRIKNKPFTQFKGKGVFN